MLGNYKQQNEQGQADFKVRHGGNTVGRNHRQHGTAQQRPALCYYPNTAIFDPRFFLTFINVEESV